MANLSLPLDPPLPSTCTLHHGDCLDVMPTLSADSVHMVFADLPYAILKHRSWDVLINFNDLWACFKAICLKNAICVFTANMKFASKIIASNEKQFRYDLVWRKTYASNFLMSKKRPLSIHENILIFGAQKHLYVPQMRSESLRKKTWNEITKPSSACNWHQGYVEKRTRVKGEMYPVSIVETFEPRTGKVHPTQKPVALLEWLIATYSNPGDTVLDPVMGSGTTGVACARLGRNFVGIEKDAAYFDVASKRIAAERERLGL